MEIVICGRNVEVPDHFREHTAEKLTRLGRYDHKIIRLSVELSHEPNPRRSKSCQRVQITGRGKGAVARGEGCAADFYSALDAALTHIEERLRRAHDRRCVRRGRRQPVAAAQAALAGPETTEDGAVAVLDDGAPDDVGPSGAWIDDGPGRGPAVAAPDDVDDDADDALDGIDGAFAWGVPAARTPVEDAAPPGTIARRKEHYAVPMSVDDALSQMELVGHDFFLFSDAETGRPSVVYRRRGYDYGVIALV